MAAEQIPPGESRFLETVLSDRYVLRSVLGRGAFATTYLGEHQILNQRVVIKLLNADATHEQEANTLFKTEAKITRALNHPSIVKILDAGASEEGQPYFAMEWIDGQNLAEILTTSGSLETNRSLQVATGIAEGLAYVHREGQLHRDLKPSNVLIPGWPGAPQYRNPKILDFGVAGRLTGGHTRVGAVFGTPRYMSPEQIRGESQTPATDVYGLGLLLFEMLTGHVPRTRDQDAISLFRAILEEELPEQELAGLQPGLATLIRGCLRRSPEERPSMDAVLKELRRLDVSDVASAALPKVELPVSYPVPASRSSGLASLWRNRWAWLALAGLIFAAAVFRFIPFHGFGRGLAFVGGVFLMAASIAGGLWLRKWLGRKSSVQEQAYGLALGAKARVDLTATIAVQLDELVSRLHGLDEQILAGTVALMLQEYGRATEAHDRQAALMNVVTLSEKLTQRLSPWYVRYKEVIASAVAVLGALSGLLAAITSLLGVHKH